MQAKVQGHILPFSKKLNKPIQTQIMTIVKNKNKKQKYNQQFVKVIQRQGYKRL